MVLSFYSIKRFIAVAGLSALLMGSGAVLPANAQVTAFKQAVAEAAARHDSLSKFYRENDFQPIWTAEGPEGLDRRKALMNALQNADDHGLPFERYGFDSLYQQMAEARTPRDLGLLEVALSKAYVAYARDVQTGMFKPSSLDDGIAGFVITFRAGVGNSKNGYGDRDKLPAV